MVSLIAKYFTVYANTTKIRGKDHQEEKNTETRNINAGKWKRKRKRKSYRKRRIEDHKYKASLLSFTTKKASVPLAKSPPLDHRA